MAFIAKQILIDELQENTHPEKVEDVIFWALEFYAKHKADPTFGKIIAQAIVDRIKECETLIITVPRAFQSFKIVQYLRGGTWLMELDSQVLNKWKIKIPNGEYEICGFINTQDKNNFLLKKL